MKSMKRENALGTDYDREENINLCNCIFGDRYSREIKEINKHEIIVKMAEILGPSPQDLCKAEEMFDIIKYKIANYIIHHEYESPKGVSMDLVSWLDTHTNPNESVRLHQFISRFLK